MTFRTSLILAAVASLGLVLWLAANRPATRPSDQPLSPAERAGTMPSEEPISPGATGSGPAVPSTR